MRYRLRLRLQADCFAGVWANRSDQQKAMLEQGDIEQAIQSASAIGDDRLQRMSGRLLTLIHLRTAQPSNGLLGLNINR